MDGPACNFESRVPPSRSFHRRALTDGHDDFGISRSAAIVYGSGSLGVLVLMGLDRQGFTDQARGPLHCCILQKRLLLA